MKTIENTTIYKCEHCGRNYQIERYCILHEPKCNRNPNNKMVCLGCDNIEKKTMYYTKWVPCLWHGETDERAEQEAFWCNAKKHWVYPRSCTNPTYEEDIKNEIANEPMPSKCKYFKCLGT